MNKNKKFVINSPDFVIFAQFFRQIFLFLLILQLIERLSFYGNARKQPHRFAENLHSEGAEVDEIHAQLAVSQDSEVAA